MLRHRPTTSSTSPASRLCTSRQKSVNLESYAFALALMSLFLPGIPPANATPETIGHIEQFARFVDAMPTGLAVIPDGRIFLSYPRWGDDVRWWLMVC